MLLTSWESRARPLSVQDVALAVDDSGSTSGDVMEMQLEHVVQPLVGLQPRDPYEKSVTPRSDFILWSSSARLIYGQQKGYFTMSGTEPVTILENESCLKLVKSRSVFVLCTDGSIGSNDVSKFTHRGKDVLDSTALVIGVIIQKCKAPGRLDISVTSALMTLGTNCLVIGMDMDRKTLRILFAKGIELQEQLSKLSLLPPSEFDENTPWTSFPALGKDWDTFLRNLSLVHHQLPPNHIMIRSDGKTVETIDMDRLLDSKEVLPMQLLLSCDWTPILSYAKQHNQQPALRRLLNRMEQPENVPNEVVQRRKRMNDLISLGLTEAKLKAEYIELLQSDLAHEQIQKRERKPIRKFCQGILAELHAKEKEHNSWQLKDHLQSNRAKRAAVVSEPDPDDLFNADLKFLETECQICYNVGPTALLLNPSDPLHESCQGSDDDSFYTSDFAIDCPLACGHHAAKKLCNFHVCFDCARFFWAQRRDMYQRPVLGVLPVILAKQVFSAEAKQAFLKTLDRSFAMGVELHHGPLLMLAAIESLGSHAWSESPMWSQIKHNMLDFLVDNVWTTEYMTSDAFERKVSVRAAIYSLSHSSQHFLSKPFAMQLLIIRLLKRYFSPPKEEELKLMQMALFSLVTVFFKTMVEFHKCDDFIRFFLTQSFDHVYGVVQRGSIHTVDFWNKEVWEKLNMSSQQKISFITGTLRGHEKLTGFSMQHMSTYWTYLLHCLSYKIHLESAMSMSLSHRRDYFLGANPELITQTTLDFQLFDNKWCKTDVFPKQGHCKDSPPYYLNLGPYSCPDVTRCHCGYALLLSAHYDTLSEAAELIRSRRREHFTKVYGSVYPNDSSHHVLMHSTVALVMCHPVESKSPLESAFQRFRVHGGRHGDIFKPDLKPDVEQCIKDFMEIQKEHNYEIPGDYLTTRSLEYKVACTLHKQGLITCEPLLFLKSGSGFDFP